MLIWYNIVIIILFYGQMSKTNYFRRTQMANRLTEYCPKKRHYSLRTFLIALVTASIIFIPFIIYHGGIFYYYGDFNVQEIPFYQLVHDAVRNGQLGWSHTTDLGSDLISSYSFYLLGSPFFWLTIPFPNEFVPYLIGPLMILKFACSALSAYIFLKRYVRNPNFAVLGGILYAFSGFSIYNVFFFHFHEPMIMFPLLLAGLDAFLYDKKRGVFALAVFASCIVNYYFFVGQVLFVVMYYLMITFSKTYKFKIKEFLILALEVIIGFSATAFLLLPSVLGLMGNPRLSELPNGWNSLVHNSPQRYWLIILGFFFPSDMPAFPIFTPDSNCKWASVAGWLPLFGMTGVIAYLQLKKRDWIKKLILLLALFAFVPVLNSMFQLMNSSIYYARWFYMIVLVFVLATIKALEDKSADWKRAVTWSTGITVGMAVLIGVMPKITEDDNGVESMTIGVQANFERFWIYVLFALASILAFVLIYKKFRQNTRRFTVMALTGTIVISLVTSFFVIATGSIASSTTEKIKKDIINSREDIKIDDLEEVRSDFYECVDNTSMFWKVQSMNCFQSSVSTSIMQFYEAMGITRDVASRPDMTVYGLRGLFSCKYFFDYVQDEESFTDKNGETKMPYWKYKATYNNFEIYENECYIPMGFTYDEYVTQEEFERIADIYNTEAILNCIVLTKEQMKKYSDITGYDEKKYSLLYGKNPQQFKSVTDSYRFNNETYKEQCEKLAKSSCDSFEYTKSGFKAHYSNNSGDNLLFFSVPYSDGFTATVNGKAVDVEKVNYGFMAVKVPANTECDIEFFYETPGLVAGVKISIVALCAYILYLSTVIVLRKRKIRKV